MSEPTYLIKLVHQPYYTSIPWSATVYRVSDGQEVGWVDSITRDDVLKAGYALCQRLAITPEPPTEFYADEDGEACDAPAPQSLRA